MEQENVGPKEAAIKAMEELGGAIAGVTLTLMSVFVPASFLPGITGQMYQQFALVLASADRTQRHQRADPDPGLVRDPPAQAAAAEVLPVSLVQPAASAR